MAYHQAQEEARRNPDDLTVLAVDGKPWNELNIWNCIMIVSIDILLTFFLPNNNDKAVFT